ncbi:MAG: lysine--tRNA ligase, partial [Acidobacteriota bacterium]
MSELDVQIAHRRGKRDALIEAGIAPYPHRYDTTDTVSAIVERHADATAEQLDEAPIEARLAGRITAVRRQGKLVFADLHDGRQRLQLFLRKNDLDDASWARLEDLDLGDIVGCRGTIMRTRKGELSLRGLEVTHLAKALRPLPEKHSGLKDIELRYRQRYVDLMSNVDARHVFETRARLVRGIRRFLDGRGFLEVETPMMQAIAGGAAARPFVTHHNALDLSLYLRIAPELYLKRLLVGGVEKVYEINRNFRNEGISTQHNPEFTMLEFYWAYVDYHALMDLTETMVVELADELLDGRTLTFKGATYDLTPPWPRYTMKQATVELGGVAPEALADVDALTHALQSRGLPLPPARSYGHLLMALFEGTAEAHLDGPVFITEHPVEVSPLAKQKADDPTVTERFELYIAGMEVANA